LTPNHDICLQIGFQGESVLAVSACTFASTFRSAHFNLNCDDRIEPQLSDLLPSIRQALSAAADGVCDGFMVRLLTTAGVIDNLPDVILKILRILGAMSDPVMGVDRGELFDPSWWFRVDDHPVFVLALDSNLPPSHPRSIPQELGTWLIFQHRRAFTGRFREEIPLSVRCAIRRSFAAAGKSYQHECGVLPQTLDGTSQATDGRKR
jgi:hypothetical protein